MSRDLAKLAHNPIGNVVSVPLQNNTNFNCGPNRGIQDSLNIQPVIPVLTTDDWNFITRTIAPVIFMPSLGPGVGAVNGVGDVPFSAFPSRVVPGHLDMGAGAIVQTSIDLSNLSEERSTK
jgi:hypothetical protein